MFQMYAVIKTGGKQYRVEEGDVLKIEKLETATGESVSFDEVLMIADGENITVGQPRVSGATVTAEVLEQGRHDKIRIIKFRRRKHYRKQQGHRQWFTAVRITGIKA
jgi:large subunit ribosomal protein L21|tara:strand:- start:30365 stop:30685 length:321 start_codon:yes stop_codon:yes gene_type:complete